MPHSATRALAGATDPLAPLGALLTTPAVLAVVPRLRPARAALSGRGRAHRRPSRPCAGLVDHRLRGHHRGPPPAALGRSGSARSSRGRGGRGGYTGSGLGTGRTPYLARQLARHGQVPYHHLLSQLERASQHRTQDWRPVRRRVQPDVPLGGAAGGAGSQARQGDGRAQDDLDPPRLRARRVHGLPEPRRPPSSSRPTRRRCAPSWPSTWSSTPAARATRCRPPTGADRDRPTT